ncbi:MAG: biopolymer transporter ExbB, partial [Methylibium sp.]|nr:biopolymer transporter ExbB [Methylibium sp.]
MISRIAGLFAAIAMAATLAVSPLNASAQAADAASAAPAAATAAPAAADAPAKAVENPYGLMALVKHGHAVDQGVLVLL